MLNGPERFIIVITFIIAACADSLNDFHYMRCISERSNRIEKPEKINLLRVGIEYVMQCFFVISDPQLHSISISR